MRIIEFCYFFHLWETQTVKGEENSKNVGTHVEVAPVLQNMQDYISNYYADELLDEVSDAIYLQLVEGHEIEARRGIFVVDHNESKIIRTDLWWKDRTRLLSDIRMRIKIGVSRNDNIPRCYVRYINFSTKFTLDGGITRHQGIRELSTFCLPECNLSKLSKHLVPVLTHDKMEVMVLQMLRKYKGEQAALTYQKNGAIALAQAMGLKIMHVSLYRNHHAAVILYS